MLENKHKHWELKFFYFENKKIKAEKMVLKILKMQFLSYIH